MFNEQIQAFYDWLDEDAPNWQIRKDAPESAKIAFKEYMDERRENLEHGIIVD